MWGRAPGLGLSSRGNRCVDSNGGGGDSSGRPFSGANRPGSGLIVLGKIEFHREATIFSGVLPGDFRRSPVGIGDLQ